MSDVYAWPFLAATFAPRTDRPSAPAAGSLDAPLVWLRVNADWLGHVVGLLDALTEPDAWAGDEVERDRAVQEVERLLAGIGEGPVSVPIGAISAYGGAQAPAGWLLCNGQAVSRAAYAALFNVIGVTYGSGDGATTFNLPDLRRRSPIGAGGGWALGAPVGAETHTLTIEELPAHTHSDRYNGTVQFYQGAAPPAYTMAGAGAAYAATGSTGGGQPHNNVGPSLAVNFIIYAGGV